MLKISGTVTLFDPGHIARTVDVIISTGTFKTFKIIILKKQTSSGAHKTFMVTQGSSKFIKKKPEQSSTFVLSGSTGNKAGA